jgi:hypothetical protein
LRLVLDAIITVHLIDQLATLPVTESAVDLFTRDTGHCSKIRLADFLANYDAPRADIPAEFLRQFEQRARDAAA